MERFRHLTLSCATLGLLARMAFAASAPDPQPLYIYLTADLSDHVNFAMTEERLRRILPMVERYRNAHPDAGITATVLFSGAVSQALVERNDQTHILDFVRDFIHRGVIEPGYDGSAEPTYAMRALVELRNANTAEERWQARAGTAEKFLTEARDLTGALEPGKSGGLKRMQEVFGQAAYISGLTLFGADPMVKVIPEVGTDTETVDRLRRHNSQAILAGLADRGMIETLKYRDWAATFSKEMSPIPETPPELYWQDNYLRFSESSGADNRMLRASAGVDELKTALAKIDRSRIRLVHVELGSDRDYLTAQFSRGEYYPPVRFAYNHPDEPKLPPEALRPSADVDKAYANVDASLQWLTEQLLAGDSRVHFLSPAALRQMAKAPTGFNIQVSALRAAVEHMLGAWGSKPSPPKYLAVEDQYLSRAEMFQAMADALAALDRSGQLPPSVRIVPVIAPIEVVKLKASGEVTPASVAHACAGFVARLHDPTGGPLPNNIIPSRVTVEGIEVHPAQFLRLMAEALAAPSPEAKLEIKDAEMFSGLDETFYKTRLVRDLGGLWTRKPVVLISLEESEQNAEQ